MGTEKTLQEISFDWEILKPYVTELTDHPGMYVSPWVHNLEGGKIISRGRIIAQRNFPGKLV